MGFWDTVDEVRKRKAETRGNKVNTVDNSVVRESDYKQKDTKDDDIALKSEMELAVDVVLMTAVEDEYRAVRKIFKNIYAENFENGFKYCLVNYEIVEGTNIVIAIFRQNNMGLVSASMTATYALTKLKPQLLLMCGVCAGVKDKAHLGDLIVFSPIFDYGSGKYSDGRFLPDYRQHQINGVVRPIVEKMCCDMNLKRAIKDTWENQSGKPDTELEIHIYPGGSGAAVITDEKIVEELRSHQRTLGAIDMESYAIAEVASAAMTQEIPWLVVKGVQDFANPLKDDRYREYAAFVSGVFIKKFLEEFYSAK
ncbi:MAG: hypothetical protein NC305_01900 [Lachnospiraceae bacterium]|nr:hypothetical protein [Butyrivibrio sp.]MCM1342391.1 hypothetical protein [Muribaculaceae bacterium]MCM1409284.1 hypothetical protein [Lachnospiraceae bacterium]